MLAQSFETEQLKLSCKMQNLDFEDGKYCEVHTEIIKIGRDLLQKLKTIENINGVSKLQKRITKEINFLEMNKAGFTLKHLKSTNMNHYEYFVETLLTQKNVIHVDRAFVVEERMYPLHVDIVCENGQKWIKVIARNPEALTQIAEGNAAYGSKSLFDQASDYKLAAEQNHCMFKPPKIVFYFQRKVGDDLINALLAMDVASCTSLENDTTFQVDQVLTVNLDISTMIAYVSNLTNGSCNWIFPNLILTKQANAERLTPVKSMLDVYFNGKMLICCKTAAESFRKIIVLMGGPEEKKRSEELLKIVKILPDTTEIPKNMQGLKLSNTVKLTSLKVFTFGYAQKATTVTSNAGFLNAATIKGINIPAFLHEPRALTELKETVAAPLNLN